VATGRIDNKSNHQEVTKLLLQNGADLELRVSKQPTMQTALELIQGVEKKAKKSSCIFDKYSVPLNPRTAAADEALIIVGELQSTMELS
jgi:cysteine synthase